MRLNKISRRSFSVVCALALAATATQVQASRVRDESDVIEGIRRYCTTSWRAAGLPADTWQDSTQDVYLRMLVRVDRNRWRIALQEEESKERRELKRAIWTVVKRHYRAKRYLKLDDFLPVLPERSGTDFSWTLAELVKQSLRLHVPRLSSLQIQILMLDCQGHKAADIARVLGLTPAKVSDQKYKATRKLRKAAAVFA